MVRNGQKMERLHIKIEHLGKSWSLIWVNLGLKLFGNIFDHWLTSGLLPVFSKTDNTVNFHPLNQLKPTRRFLNDTFELKWELNLLPVDFRFQLNMTTSVKNDNEIRIMK